MGAADLGSLMNTPHKNAAITCLCDVDDRQSVDARKTYPKAKYFNDFREMYEKEGKNFDAVCISTPDHNHAIQLSALCGWVSTYICKTDRARYLRGTYPYRGCQEI